MRQTLDEKRHLLPPGVQLVKVYDRSDLVRRVDVTLLKALVEEVAAVVLVILLFLLHGRSAIVPLLTLPVVMLSTFAAMWLFNVPASLMSLGGMGIALGIAVDADVVALEACHRRLAAMGDGGSAAAATDPDAGGGRGFVHAGGRVVAADHRAHVPAGLCVHRRDRSIAGPARAHQDAGHRLGRAG